MTIATVTTGGAVVLFAASRLFLWLRKTLRVTTAFVAGVALIIIMAFFDTVTRTRAAVPMPVLTLGHDDDPSHTTRCAKIVVEWITS